MYGFEDLFYKNNPNFYKKMKDKYEENFVTNIDVKVESDINLFAKGNILKVIDNER